MRMETEIRATVGMDYQERYVRADQSLRLCGTEKQTKPKIHMSNDAEKSGTGIESVREYGSVLVGL